MASTNKDELFKRRLIDLNLGEDGKWHCKFKVPNDPIEHDGIIEHVHNVSEQSLYNVALEVMGNFCITDTDEDRWWKPQLLIEDLELVEEQDLRWMRFKFANGVVFNAEIGEATVLEVIENILIYGISYYFDRLIMSDAYTVVDPPEENWKNCIIKVMDNFEVLLRDNANYPVTEEQIHRAIPYIYRIVAMLRGAYNSPMRVGASGEWLCALVSDMSIPSFEMRTNPSVEVRKADMSDAPLKHVNPGYIAFEDISYVVRDENQTPLLIVNE